MGLIRINDTLGTFYYCTGLEKVDFNILQSINQAAFYGCSSLKTVIIRSENICYLDTSDAFKETPIETGTGYIYVPSALVDNYKAATNWSTYANQIRAIEDYPDICG